MSVDGFWWFYKVDPDKFEAVQSEFKQAADGVPDLPKIPGLSTVPALSTQPQVISETHEYDPLWVDCLPPANELYEQIYHKPFESIAYRINYHQLRQYQTFAEDSFSLDEDIVYRTTLGIPEEERSLTLDPEDLVGMVMQNRVMPTAILLLGIGSERFSQLPGYMGNMLIEPQATEQALKWVSLVLDVDWDVYAERAKPLLAFSGSDNQAERDVAQVLHAIPNALERVTDEGAGLLALTSWGCP